MRVVGFSCTFQQNVASFALARRLKERYPELVTVFGGANFDGEMGLELVRSVDCIDLAVSGEADASFPALLRALATGGDPAAVPGVICRATVTARLGAARPPACLDDLPVPDYGEYFERAERLKLLPPRRAPPGVDPVRERPRVLVGRQAPLHVLRPQRDGDAVPRQVAAAGCSTSWRRWPGGTAASASRRSTTSSTCAT